MSMYAIVCGYAGKPDGKTYILHFVKGFVGKPEPLFVFFQIANKIIGHRNNFQRRFCFRAFFVHTGLFADKSVSANV